MNETRVRIDAGNVSAEFLPDSGMLGVSLRYRGDELLRRIDDLDTAKRKGSSAGIPLLYPWANRLASLDYRVGASAVKLGATSPLLHFDERGLPMHGVPWGQLPWTVREARRDSLLASLDWKRPELLAIFPFAHRLELAANVAPNSLTIQTTVFADSGSAVPISFGFHPYLGIPNLPRTKWRLQLPVLHRLLTDARGIPTGASEPFGAIDKFLGDCGYDDGFVLNDDPAPRFAVSGGGMKLTIAFLEGYGYTQVFAPKGKEFIAIEPMTAETNALISGKGLRILEAGAEFRASYRIAVEQETENGKTGKRQ